MKVAGIVLVLTGVAFLAAGGVSLVGILRRVAQARVVRTIPFQGETLVRSRALEVSTERLCQVGLVFHPDLRAFGDVDAREISRDYGVDARVRVFDDAGKVLLREDIGHERMWTISNGWTGSVELGANTEKFVPPASGRIQVEATWTPRVSPSRTKGAELKVYDRVSDHRQAGGVAALLGVSGGAATLLGAGLLLPRLFGRKAPPAAKPSNVTP